VNAEDRLAEATGWFMRMRSDDAREEDLARLKEWLEQHPENPVAYGRVSATWSAVGEFASSPEVIVGRRDALEHARRATLRRWSKRMRLQPLYGIAAAAACALLALALLWQNGSWRGEVYETGVGERRVLTLKDGSVIHMDARSHLRVNFAEEARSIELDAGQASFEVARNPARPFRVRAGGHTVVALGTAFNVEVVRDTLLVTLLEGRVAVVPATDSDAGRAHDETPGRAAAADANSVGAAGLAAADAEIIELVAGQQLVAAGRAPAEIKSNVDLARATAWQSGKLFFDDEPLVNAAARMNRYARVQVEVDSSVGDISISGVFKAGDTGAFTDAVTTYFPVRVESTGSSTILLTAK